MIVDAHTHIFPPEVVSNRQRFTAANPEFAAIYSDPTAPMATAEQLLGYMDNQGVDRAWVVGFPWREEAHAREHNDYLAEVARTSGGRIKALGGFWPGASWARREAERVLGMGMAGLGELAYYGQNLDTKALGKICALAAEAGAIVMLHTNEPVGHRYPGKAPMTLAALYELIKANPATRLVLAHMGGGIFFYCLMKREVREVLANCWLDTAAAPFLYRPRAYALAVELMGAEKILLGTDYPLLGISRYRRELTHPEAGLGKEELKWILGRAAEQLIP